MGLSKEQVTRWLEELRSGKHKQCEGSLVSKEKDGTESYCCLGIAQKFVPGMEAAEPYSSYNYNKMLPNTTLQKRTQQRYSTANDDGKTFTQIADRIEADYKANPEDFES